MRARAAFAIGVALAVGIAAGAIAQRTIGFGNALHWLGLSHRVDTGGGSASETGAEPPSELGVPLAYHGRMSLFILAGQSNMVGLAPVPVGEEGRTHPRVYLFGNDYRWRLASEPVDDPRNQVDMVSEDRLAGYGPSLAFALESVERRPELVIGLVPCAKSASSIAEWQPDRSDRSLYGSCLKRVRAASTMGSVAALLFLQGEADALDPSQDPGRRLHPTDWAEQFAHFVNVFREDVGDNQLPVVFAQIGTTIALQAFTNWEVVRAQQASVRLSGTAMITTADLALFDGLHFTAASYRVIGERFASAYWNLVESSLVRLPGAGPR